MLNTLAQQAPQPLEQAAPFLFYAMAILAVVSSWAVAISQNIVRMAVFLLLTLLSVAGFYFMMSAELLAAIQLIVYAGGILILIIFGVMLTSRNPFAQLKVQLWEGIVGTIVALAIGGLLVWALVTTTLPDPNPIELTDYNQVTLIGKSLLSRHLVAFEASAVVLLVVMIGAAYMARRRQSS